MDITSLWNHYAARVLPPQAGASQRRGTKLAFVSGCVALSEALRNADFKDMTACLKQLEALSAEGARVITETAYSN